MVSAVPMVVVGVAVVAAPFVLMWVFNGRDRADSRGRRTDRTDRTWRT